MSRAEDIENALTVLAPHAPKGDISAIVDQALGSRGLKKAAPAKAAWLSLVAYVRHYYTEYDGLLDEGYGVEAARFFCREQINEVLAAWGCRQRLSDTDDQE